MSSYLKTNTAVTISLGPFLDKTDGVTPETALTVANCRITAVAETDDNSAPTLVLDNVAGNDATNTLAHITGDDAGYYSLKLTAANTNRLGRFTVQVNDAANHCPVFKEFMILPANVYDSLVLNTDKLDANVEEWNATAVPAEHTAGYPIVTVKDGTGTGEIDTASGRVAITEAQIDQVVDEVWDELKSAHTVADSFGDYLDDEITSRAAPADIPTAAVVADAVWDEDATGHQTQGSFGQAIGDPGVDADTIWGLANTNLNATVSSRASQTSVDAIDDFVDTEIADIQSRLPAALVGGRMDANVGAISGDAVAADNAELYFDGTGYGQILQRTTIATLATQTSFTLTAGSADNNAYNGCIIVVEDSVTQAKKAVGVISGYTGATKTIALLNDPAVFTMAVGDIVTIIADKALKPTVDNRTLDTTTGGNAGIDWNNIESPSAVQNLAETRIDTDQTIAGVNGNVGGNVVGSVGNVVNDVGGNVVGSVGALAAQAKADVRDAVGLATANLDTQLGNLIIQKNAALNNFEFLMVDSADHVTPKTGLTITAQRSIDGGAFAACANSVTEVGSGVYKINLAATDLNGDVITLKFTATGADQTTITVVTQA